MMNKADDHEYYLEKEPSRFEPRHVDELLIHSNRIKASDITIQTNSPIICEIYGKLYKITRHLLTNAEVSDLINTIYGPNGTTQIQRGEDLDTHFEVRPNRHERYRHRVNAVGCYVAGQQGIQITIRTIPSKPPSLESLGIPLEIMESCCPQEGVVYVTGATGSGKSTLLAAMIKKMAEDPDSHRKILTYEAPIEFVFDGLNMPTSIVSQSEIPKHLPSFSSGVRNALRRKPHLIMVGESRDSETISAVVEAALTGHPVYTTLHSNGVAESIRRLVGAFSKEERAGKTIDIIETCRLIIWQRLAPSTDGTRVALREYLVFSEAVRDELLNSDLNNITATSRYLLEKYGQTMQSDIEDKYKQGLLSERTYKILTARYVNENHN